MQYRLLGNSLCRNESKQAEIKQLFIFVVLLHEKSKYRFFPHYRMHIIGRKKGNKFSITWRDHILTKRQK
jgi:hypothetical protein